METRRARRPCFVKIDNGGIIGLVFGLLALVAIALLVAFADYL
jgi:hypothetical protein